MFVYFKNKSKLYCFEFDAKFIRCAVHKMGNRFHIPANPDKNAGKNWHRGRFVRWKYEACEGRAAKCLYENGNPPAEAGKNLYWKGHTFALMI